MALFRRLFHRKPPDGLLEISERVYVFDNCLSAARLEEDECKIYMGGIAAQLQDFYPDSSFMVFNFREGDRRTHISDILSQYDMTVMEYPRQYEGCPMLPLEMIHHFLLSSESWLSLAGQQSVLLMHCERGGWPLLAFMLAALLLFRKQYNGERKTLEMVYKQAPRELLHLLTPLNPQPSHLRYLQYISRRNLGSDWPPSDTPLALDCIILRALHGFVEKGCRLAVRIYGRDSTSNRSSKFLFSSSKTKKHARYYLPEECEQVKIDIHHRVQGDVVLECIHLDSYYGREEVMFRVMFHTAFVQANVLMLSRDEFDVMWDALDEMPKNFRAELLFSDADNAQSTNTSEGEFEDGNETKGLWPEEFSPLEEIYRKLVFQGRLNAENRDIVFKEETTSDLFQDYLSRCGYKKPETTITSEGEFEDGNETKGLRPEEFSKLEEIFRNAEIVDIDFKEETTSHAFQDYVSHYGYKKPETKDGNETKSAPPPPPPPRHGGPSPPPPPPRHGAPPPSRGVKGEPACLPKGGRTDVEDVESQKFWEEFWEKVGITLIEEKVS